MKLFFYLCVKYQVLQLEFITPRIIYAYDQALLFSLLYFLIDQ